MIFSSLRTTSFRNLSDEENFLGSKNVFFVGKNGQGKTNFLEALYFCSYASSFRTIHDSELARDSKLPHNAFLQDGEKDFSAEGKLLYDKQSSQTENAFLQNEEILVKYEKNKKSIFINGKKAEDRKELLSIAPSIVFCHEDMEFVSGSPERRRWFFDQTLSLYDPVYLDDLRRYKHILKSRNALLKDFIQKKYSGSIDTVLDALDPQFAMYGLKLMEKRETAVKDFSAILGNLYEEVSGISGISVQYTQSWKYMTESEIISNLQQRRAADTVSGISLSGPHRDRYLFAHNAFQRNEFLRNGADFTIKASTGQRRLLALLLRAAQAGRFSAKTGQNPILLLDDVLLEMDGEKRRRFLSVLPDYDQAFFTFLPEEPYQHYQKEDTLVYTVHNGQLKKS